MNDVEARRFRDIADAAPALLWSTDASGAADWFSAGWLRFTGRSLDSLLGDGWTREVHPEDVERCVAIRATSAEARHPFSLDYRLRHRDGGYRWVYDSAMPRLDVDGRLLGYVGSCIDIHERKELEEKLAERTQALRLAERRQGAFLATLSHELRNPLAPIANAASVLRTLESSNPILARLREILERQVGRLGRLVEDLIDVTQSAQGEVSLINERVGIDGVVQAAIAASQEKIDAGHHTIDLHMPEQRLAVKGDPARLSQALSNIIVNAAKFSGEPSAITIEVQPVAKTVQVKVKDHGRGIDPSFLPHVFELFSQEDQSFARTYGGLGVGLTLARRIAQLHGGDVEAFSEGPGRGSEFVLWLPLLEGELEAPAAGEVPNLAERYRVLIVEDNGDARESLRLHMEMWGNEVVTAHSAEAALEAARTFKPHIVLCDLGLPGIDGLQLLGPLRRRLAGQRTLIAAVTGHGRSEDQARAMAAGFDSFLVKPLHPASLARLLQAYASQGGN
ncbi:PAS domain-containing hybrid sensor histidine kinase/response regulator [Piscinibacter koreensis]|uniref:histidine kinase n=1 Tax=Piscinibacter koreensis TaxID=2742824 RepID=A0A7Y6NKR9_9BURK|nr:ATP-binding protein [Schlegelella koreensis]NUZ04977.1 response regulator [Schlegelella koreensis]